MRPAATQQLMSLFDGLPGVWATADGAIRSW
jgi:hypothetical protein